MIDVTCILGGMLNLTRDGIFQYQKKSTKAMLEDLPNPFSSGNELLATS